MKKIILVVMCILLCSVLFAEEALWIITDDTPAWKGSTEWNDFYIHNITKTLPKGTKVMLSDLYVLGKENIIDRDGCIEYARDAYTFLITVDDEYYIEPKNIIPIDTPDLFDESFLTVAHYPHRYLIPSYFEDVLKSGTRYTMEKYEKDFIKAQGGDNPGEYDPFWWELPVITEEAVITQSFLRIKLLQKFLVKRIEKIPNGYKVDVKRTKMVHEDYFFPPDRFEYPLFFQFDGDYVDVYVDNLSNKVFSLTYVSPDFYEGVKTVIELDKAVDLSNLIWPRRLDGSSDYDDDIIPRQELPQIYRDPLDDTSIAVDETTTVEEFRKVIAKTASMDLLNNKDSSGRTPVQIAIANNANIEIIELLIELQGDGVQALLLWALESSPEIISFLLNAGASLNTVDNRPITPNRGSNILEIAESWKYPSYDIFSKLIEMGWEENSDDKIIWQERGKTYLTTDNLRLRAEEGVSGEPLFTLPKDTPVHILSIGSIDKIDEIFAYWVEVAVAEDTVDTQVEEVKKGAVGWCFGGYVTTNAEDIVYEAPPIVVAEVVPEVNEAVLEIVAESKEPEPEFERREQNAPIPTFIITTWLVTGGAILLVCAIGVVVFVRKKKK